MSTRCRGTATCATFFLGDKKLGTNTCVALSSLFLSPNTKLTGLNIKKNQIDDVRIAILTTALVRNSVLTELNLSFNCSITQMGWRAFAEYLRSPDSALKLLDLGPTNITK